MSNLCCLPGRAGGSPGYARCYQGCAIWDHLLHTSNRQALRGDALAGVARDRALMPDGFQDADMRRFDFVDAQLAQRLADHLDDALELGPSGGMLQASLICCSPLVGELAEHARPLGPAFFVA